MYIYVYIYMCVCIVYTFIHTHIFLDTRTPFLSPNTPLVDSHFGLYKIFVLVSRLLCTHQYYDGQAPPLFGDHTRPLDRQHY